MTDMEFENQLRAITSGMEYPRTPDVAGRVMVRLQPLPHPRFISRKLAWSLTIVFVLLSSLLLIPPVRAAVIEFFQIGVVRIFPRSEATPLETPITATPSDTSSLLIPLLENIAGETKLANAQQTASYPILLPTYPPHLGQPNHVYVQDADGAMTVLVWTDPSHPENVILSLHFIPTGSWAIKKSGPVVVQETQVNGRSAIWAEGPYPLLMRNGYMSFTRLINGHVLIWANGDVTYRLETDLSMEETIKIAESLEPIP